jgi:hypothetical protein|tara:strand:- start:187 stop:414 length:228 start_codon:yes stop_codon:yes gene_type:complete
MDVDKWKSVAVKKQDYTLLKAICKDKYRAPGAMISKLINNHIEYEAKKNKTTVENVKKKLLNGDNNDDRERSKKS